MRKNKSQFLTAYLSEAGTLAFNKCQFGFVELDDFACWVIAESVDKSEAQESAKLVVDQILNDFRRKPALSKTKVRQYLNQAHERLKDESKNVRLKVSLVMLVTDYTKIIWAVTGNLRLYHFRGGAFNFRSKDLSIAQLMIDSGNLTEDEVNNREERNNILGFLGSSTDFVPAISEIYRLQDGDTILLCNIGFWEHFKNSELTTTLNAADQPEEFLGKLREQLLEKGSNRLRNYTLAAVYARRVFQDNSFSVVETAREMVKEKNVAAMLRGIIAKCFKETAPDYRILARKAVWILLPLVLLLFAAGFFVNKHVEAVRLQKQLEHKKQVELMQKQTINRHEANGNHWVSLAKYPQAVTEYQKALQVLNSYKDRQKEQVIRTKRDISKLIITADRYLSDGNYSEALQNYNSALQKGAAVNYDQAGLTERINRTRQLMDLEKLVQNGDEEYARQNFAVAREKYQLALSIAEQLTQEDLKVELSRKIGNIDHNIAVIERQKKARELERQKAALEMEQRQKNKESALKSTPKTTKEPKLSKAARLELAGDDKFTTGLYKEAIELYRLAKTAYEERGLYQGAAVVNEKIKKAKRMRLKSFF